MCIGTSILFFPPRTLIQVAIPSRRIYSVHVITAAIFVRFKYIEFTYYNHNIHIIVQQLNAFFLINSLVKISSIIKHIRNTILTPQRVKMENCIIRDKKSVKVLFI